MTHTSDADPLPEANHQSKSSDFSPAFSIGSLPIYGQLILAPMDGISDPPFRLITRRLGSALSLSEFINTLDFSVQKHFQQSRFAFQPQERPFGIQLLDNDPQRMADSAGEIYAKYKPDFFDINLGCATARIASRGAGVGLMRTPEKVAQIFQLINQAVPVPLTAKIRLGWDEDTNKACKKDEKGNWILRQKEFCPKHPKEKLEIKESGIYDTDYEPIRIEKELIWVPLVDCKKGERKVRYNGPLSERQEKLRQE